MQYIVSCFFELARRVDPISVSVSPKVLHVPLNQSAQFTCRAKSATDYTLKWTRGMHGALPDGVESVNGVLTIKNTQIIHGGTYTCTGKNSFNDDMVTVQLRLGGEKTIAIELVKLSIECSAGVINQFFLFLISNQAPGFRKSCQFERERGGLGPIPLLRFWISRPSTPVARWSWRSTSTGSKVI